MAKLRKMLGSAKSPYIISLMGLIETQSKETIANWCVGYVKEHILKIYEKTYPEDFRLRVAIEGFYHYQEGNIKLPELKKLVAQVNVAAREAEGNPAAQAAARAVGAGITATYTPTSSLGIAFYGSAAIAYDKVGVEETQEIYEQIASIECSKMERALKNIAVQNEKNPAKINWYC